MHRLTPWLHRELVCVCVESVHPISFITQSIQQLLKTHDMISDEFKSNIRSLIPFSNNVDHFIHELTNFARSPFDMVGYDRYVTYLPRFPQGEFNETHAIFLDFGCDLHETHAFFRVLGEVLLKIHGKFIFYRFLWKNHEHDTFWPKNLKKNHERPEIRTKSVLAFEKSNNGPWEVQFWPLWSLMLAFAWSDFGIWEDWFWHLLGFELKKLQLVLDKSVFGLQETQSWIKTTFCLRKGWFWPLSGPTLGQEAGSSNNCIFASKSAQNPFPAMKIPW